MTHSEILIKNASEHNLKQVSLRLPRNQLIVFTGVSGSGKSSLAFDTIFAEGQRRYVESLSAYARQFLGQMRKPDVEHIEGLSPAISIDQKSASHNPRSTVGTVTEIYDYLRLLYARIGIPHCPDCGQKIQAQSLDQIVDQIRQWPEGTKIGILAPLIRGRKGEYKSLLDGLLREGFSRVKVDGVFHELGDEIPLAKQKKHDISLVIDRLKLKEEAISRLTESIQLALKKAEGLVEIENLEEPAQTRLFNQNLSCPDCGFSFPEVEPRLFSFNSPFGACKECHGLGARQEIVPEKIIPVPSLSIAQGAVRPWSKSLDQSGGSYLRTLLEALQREMTFDLDTPFEKLPEEIQHTLLHGSEQRMQVEYRSKSAGQMQYSFFTRFEGVIPRLQRLYSESTSDSTRQEVEQYMEKMLCPVCEGRRLQPVALAVRIGEHSIADITGLSIENFHAWLENCHLNPREAMIAALIMRELKERSGFLLNVGLDYLTLDRSANTLSGGEAQRIRLATQIGSGLVGVLYILDEPSIGLHQRDNERLLKTLERLRDLGNTLIVVEHDEDTIRAADHLVDIGPRAGRHGGEVVAQGSLKEIMGSKESLTGQYLSGKSQIEVPKKRKKGNGHTLSIRQASRNNLQNLDLEIPLGQLICVTGVSGSGKSTLINEILAPWIWHELHHNTPRPQGVLSVEGIAQLDKLIIIDQSPIGRTPRSNPATYTGLFTPIRELFAQSVEAKVRGFQPGRFSFNVKGGRCESCQGDGMNKIEMHFLPDVYVPCEVCKSQRYNRETLAVKWKDASIADVLNMTVEEALEHFANIPALERKLQTLSDVGLDYIQLGQPANTLSGGEAQRVKLATELSKRSTGKTMYLLDEPTTGLHFADVAKLLDVIQRLVNKGNTVLVIEHNLDVIKVADHLIDLGPEGGDKGGRIVAQGTPEEVAQNPASHTGRFLRPLLKLPVKVKKTVLESV
ncbi:excinuclease ABC subunit UvrA [bacterium (Candidatus Blackallbacteria) CG17_big_fil_post_rev_8_21_14_2_50_48_46]|uniref:UvrABC system protein A n=1 Tax=bacterium (Candidatus Blackallbacteria) CG17_big_fil_post_rev_8_21_14_2_50_48_46 TaxID=2014261 RepID=A0A2M7FXI5_9BACT|nr:MAG: excinuclease ABC subunit A [bacterium (Candidatus Blackallbacteria) CG18_big_fil_WC_8_21_14_2_50_49_26]PIW13968.1 MAG: excinuclease ABC subunit UvrA [bacterium (Candidatus Blackallbacteria) CG17_big_fil_post_rev_8_21_14_2_50_48_46]PIW46819.1 MAG: excinuclease ABC subunit UvrA [bacterium (Candidatus Blackallbacteria) CG13_big_fil_rev_8_21_14_2_50_49_14]